MTAVKLTKFAAPMLQVPHYGQREPLVYPPTIDTPIRSFECHTLRVELVRVRSRHGNADWRYAYHRQGDALYVESRELPPSGQMAWTYWLGAALFIAHHEGITPGEPK